MNEDKFRHDCSEWDNLSIGSHSIELTCCRCFEETKEFTDLKNTIREEYDLIMEDEDSNE